MVEKSNLEILTLNSYLEILAWDKNPNEKFMKLTKERWKGYIHVMHFNRETTILYEVFSSIQFKDDVLNYAFCLIEPFINQDFIVSGHFILIIFVK